MNKKTRILAAVLCASLLTAATGCNNSGASSGTSAQSSAQDSSTASQSSQVSESTGSTESSSEVSSEDSSQAETSSEQSSSANNKPVGVDGVQTNGQLVVDIDGHTWGISLYGGGDGANYAQYLNEFKEKVGSGVNVVNMVVPTAGA